MVLRPAAILGDPLEVQAHLLVELLLRLVQLLLSEQARLNALGELHLLLSIEERHLSDLLEVVLDGVSGRPRDSHGLDGLISVVDVGDGEALLFTISSRLVLLHIRISLYLSDIHCNVGFKVFLEDCNGLQLGFRHVVRIDDDETILGLENLDELLFNDAAGRHRNFLHR